MKLRVGVIGLGKLWQTRHAPALRALSDRYEIRAVCEQVSHRAQQVAGQFGAAPVDGFRNLVSRDDVDAVLMLAPQWFGALPIFAACDAGKAVYCCGALDVDFDEARRLRCRVERAGIAFMAELPRRLAPATLRLKELIATRLGQPRLLFCHQRLPQSQLAANGRESVNASHNLIELVDWCRFIVGREPTSVLSVSHPSAEDTAANDYEMLSLDFEAAPDTMPQATAQISCGDYLPGAWPEAITFRPPAALQVACENGIAFVDLPNTLIWFDEAGRHQEGLESERPVGEQLLSQFYRAVTSLVRRSSDLEDAYRSMAIVIAARTGQQEGRRVPLQFEDPA